MTKIMAVNAGSSSLKFQLFEMDQEIVITSGIVERIGLNDSIFTIKFNNEKQTMIKNILNHSEAVDLVLKTLIDKNIVKSLDEIQAVGHRVVQGGSYFSESVICTDDVKKKIESLIPLAPLHNKAHLIGIDAFEKAIPNAKSVVVFDTAFHQTMKEDAYIYPIPYKYYKDFKVRKYGAHGTSHAYITKETIKLLNSPKESNIIVCHLGAGSSLCAVKNGQSIDTSMGLTPLAGVMMATRCGDIDPSVIDFLAHQTSMSIDKITTMLNKQSGLLGVSEISSDMRDLLAQENTNKQAKLAIDIYVNRVCDFIGQYYIKLGHIDAISFTAGIGENSAPIRKKIVDKISCALSVSLDEEKNNASGVRNIATQNSKFPIFVIPTNEELVIARDTKRLLNL